MNSGPIARRTQGWALGLALFFTVLLILFAAYGGTVASMVRVWRGSDTFAHGFFILPISVYLAWLKRDRLAALVPRPYPPGLALLVPLGLAWLVGRAASAQVVEQFCMVAMIPVVVLGFFGPGVTRLLAFPLGFLFFAVPIGDGLQPALMDFTASFAMAALRLSGVPVVREGLFLTTPVAQWRVADSCSGLRFLVSGVALSCLFAYLNYRPFWKRVGFTGLSIVALILANGFRAYALILMGYWTDLRLGLGLGHIMFGWLVFAAVMAAFFLIGSKYRDVPAAGEATAAPKDATPSKDRSGVGPRAWIAVALVAAALLLVWPGFYAYRSHGGPAIRSAFLTRPEPREGWSFAADELPALRPRFLGAAAETTASYVKDGAVVRCYIAFYDRQGQGRELIQYPNAIVAPNDPHWRVFGEGGRTVDSAGERFDVLETDVRASDASLLVWSWYWLPDQFTTSHARAKLLQARASLLLGRDHAAAVVLFASDAGGATAAEHLRRFVGDMTPSIRAALRRADAGS